MKKKLLVSLVGFSLFIFMAVTIRSFDYFSILFTLLFLLVAAIPTYQYVEHQKIERLHKAENLANGAEDEPRIIRNLTTEEELILKDKIRQSKRLYDSLWLIITVAAIIDIASIWFIIKYQEFRVTVQFVGAFILAQVVIIAQILKHPNLYLDLRSPIFRVAGYAIKEKHTNKHGTNYYLYVRGIKFTESQFPKLEKVFDEIPDKEKIEVEYSPRTRYVWSWKKL